MEVSQLLVAANRGPVATGSDDPGHGVARSSSSGGLAATLTPALAGINTTWVAASPRARGPAASSSGAPGSGPEILRIRDDLGLLAVEIDEATYRAAYDVVCNATLWYCHHHLFDPVHRPVIRGPWYEAWDAYRAYNRAFATAIAGAAPLGATVLLQDYHLSLAGSSLAAERPDLICVHFSHTPWAAPDMLAMLPNAIVEELVRGITACRSAGFHTSRWAVNFQDGVAMIDPGLLKQCKVHVSPLGPNPDELAAVAASASCRDHTAAIDALAQGRKLVVRTDRLEPSKNIPRGFAAFDELLARCPEWREQVVFLARLNPSRENLAEYQALRMEVELAAREVNERWATPDWTPVELEIGNDFTRSIAALRRADVLVVNALRDGLNLVAKEGPLVNERDAALVLSRETGAWEELAEASFGVNPFDVSETAGALDAALRADDAERRARAAELRKLAGGHNATDWVTDELRVAAGLRLR